VHAHRILPRPLRTNSAVACHFSLLLLRSALLMQVILQHIVVEGGQNSAMWMSQTPPMMWPDKVGQTKVTKATRDNFDVTDADYLRRLPEKSLSDLSGRVTCILTKSEKSVRHARLRREEADEVASLKTPRDAQKEQILEEALRQLQVWRCHSVTLLNVTLHLSAAWRVGFSWPVIQLKGNGSTKQRA
jgi:hypothetical protein